MRISLYTNTLLLVVSSLFPYQNKIYLAKTTDKFYRNYEQKMEENGK